jgi:hypothetical protein
VTSTVTSGPFNHPPAVYWNIHVLLFAIDALVPELFPKAKEQLWLADGIGKGEVYCQAHPILVAATKIDKLNAEVDLAEMSRVLDIEELAKLVSAIALKVG